jgi:DNA-binding CsgD family transcriptional regulator
MTAVGSRAAGRSPATTPRERELQRRVAEFAADAGRLLGDEPSPPAENAALVEESVPYLTVAAQLTVEQIRSAGRRSRRLAELCQLSTYGADLLADLREHDLRRRQRALAGVQSSLVRMRCMTTADELVEAVCPEIVRNCGFARAMLSRVVDRTWMPWMAHFEHREIRESDREWMANTRIPLNSMMLERDLLQERRPAFVADASADPRALKRFITDVGTSSYAAAPIVPEGRVVGFLHADHYPSSRPVDEVDSYVLGELADGFGRIYERVTLLERLRGQRGHVRETLRAVEEIMENVARAELELARRADERSIVGAAAALAVAGEPSNLDELLTPREREVITLIVGGQSNSAIAERLVISEGTVKSHVKQILRKLGAVNRSEVIARYLGMLDAK